MSTESSEQNRSAIRQPLSRDLIITTAIEMVDSEGLSTLSMRRLGKRLGVEAMALYRYLPNRESLLNAMVDRVVEQMQADPDDALARCTSRAEFLRTVAVGIRSATLCHPRLYPLIASQPPEAPWLRPPIRSLQWVESFMEGLRKFDTTEEDTIFIYRSFTTFLLGSLLLEVSWDANDLLPGIDSTPSAEEAPPAEVCLANYPVLKELAPRLSRRDDEAEFMRVLDHYIASVS